MPEDLIRTQIKQIKIVEPIAAAIENGKIKIVPNVLVKGGRSVGDGLTGMVTKLLPGVDIPELVKKSSSVVPDGRA